MKNSFNLKLLKQLSLLSISFLLTINTYSQSTNTHVFEEWADPRGTQDVFHHSKTITDANGNIYMIGSSINGTGNYDIMVAKYDRHGTIPVSYTHLTLPTKA